MKPSSLSRDFPATSARRARNSRGTKEAKKRAVICEGTDASWLLNYWISNSAKRWTQL